MSTQNRPFPNSLCHQCRHLRLITSGKGTVFLLCQRSQADPTFLKYPPQPVYRCSGLEPATDAV